MSPSTSGRSKLEYAIGLDVGGTKIAGGVVSADGDIVERLPTVLTPADTPEATIQTLTESANSLRALFPGVRAIGIGAAGLISWPSGYIRWAPNNSYKSLPLRHLMEQATGLSVIVDNDANAAAWAEACLARSATHFAFLTVGTGVGGGLVVNGRLFRGRSGIGAEVGHMIVDPQGQVRCGCGNIGCLESVASGTALTRYGTQAAVADPSGKIAMLANGRVTGETVLAAAHRSDPTALGLFRRIGYWLGVGIGSLANLFEFERFVLGGGVASAAGDLIIRAAQESADQFLFARSHRNSLEIVPAQLGADAGWIGAGLLALRHSEVPNATGCSDALQQERTCEVAATSSRVDVVFGENAR